MKKIFIFFQIVLVFTGFVSFNCGGKKALDVPEAGQGKKYDHGEMIMDDSTDAIEQPESGMRFQVDITFQKQLSNVFLAYVSLKDALVSAAPEEVGTRASNTLEMLRMMDMELLSEDAHHAWMNYFGEMETSLHGIRQTNNIEVQREAFNTLSGTLHKSIKAYGLGGTTAYYEFCPMAFKNKGGFWLSMEKEIRNPYFGDKMLTCGEVREILQ